MSNSSKKCIFCPSPGPLTDEHIWGDWILNGGHVPRTQNKHKASFTVINRPGVADERMVHTKAGDPLGANIRIVCAECNNGWMSRVQERAKPQLIPLLKGNAWALGVNAQRAIAAWACMATMTSEYLSRQSSSVSISQNDRDLIRQQEMPPPSWRVWLGCYDRQKWVGQWTHTTVPILEEQDIPPGTPAPPNTQTTTFIIGKLYVHTMCSHFPENTKLWDWRPVPHARRFLVPIWPLERGIVGWPPQRMSDKDAQDFSMAFFNTIDTVGRSFGF